MATLLLLVQWGRAVGPAASDRLYRHLTRSFWDEGARALLPPWVQTASLQGAIGSSRSELMFVHGPSGSWVCCVITADQEDKSWETGNEGYVLIRKLSEILWHHYEPYQAWTAPRPGTRWN
ncbi:MAG: serine hydrolase, partial [Planctomycetota bacterium]